MATVKMAAEKNGNRKKWQWKIGQKENAATRNERVRKKATKN